MQEKAIAPGTNAEAIVIFSLRGRKGRQRKSFYIASNDRARPYLQLRLQGTAVAKEGPAPLSVDFGQISPDGTDEKQVRIACGSGSAFSITGLVSTAAQFSVCFFQFNDGQFPPAFQVRDRKAHFHAIGAAHFETWI